ncbi:MAG TPA: hypothetical protein VMH87_05250 [Pseudomonadales bacterium]|nr:hypothetical protein [Pseudomonadales bacterium]
MKTPREILLARHKVVEPKLDDIRHESVRAVSSTAKAASPAPPSGERVGVRGQSVLQLLWHELILPSRSIWTGLAAVWILIFAANFSMRDHAPLALAKSSSAPEMVQNFRQQEQLLTELIGPNESIIAEPQKAYKPRPSSQRLPEILAA